MSVRNLAILAQTALLGATLVPVKYYRPGHYIDGTPRDLKATEQRIIKRGYDIDGLRRPGPEDKELLEHFRAVARKAGQPDAPLLIAISKQAYAGVADQYVVVSEPVEKNFTAAEQDGIGGHELYHRDIEKKKGKQYEDFSPAELKIIETEADKYSYYLIPNAAAIESGLKKMETLNEKADFDSSPLFFRVLFPNSTSRTIDQYAQAEQVKHPATSKRVDEIAQLDESEQQARKEMEAKTRRRLAKTSLKPKRPAEPRAMVRNDTSSGDRGR
jgi:Zn-dependent protease with chaperone function